MSQQLDSEVQTTQGIVRLWLHEAGMMNKHSTAIALQQIALEIGRNVAIVGDASAGAIETAPKGVISSEGSNLVDISHNFEVD
ncbi:MAG: hypothetical protein KME43_25335 [Myxacorys chilensis ATA2-1-KO14]|jgi:hypothetical protein|nr:hypothetical protein [Myxacorys chilensis ATA2-1-KO14]